MRIGLQLPFGPGIAELVAIAGAAEDAGCDSVWASDHVIRPVEVRSAYPYGTSGRVPVEPFQPLYDVWVLLTAIAAATDEIKVATGVYLLPLRHALLTARAAATLDEASCGRLLLGVGVGWMREEFDALGVDFASRGVVTNEAIAALRELWAASPAQWSGAHVSFPPLYLEPKAWKGRQIPIHIGGESEAALGRAALLGDGWVSMTRDPDALARIVAALHRHRQSAGRGSARFEVTARCDWPIRVHSLQRYAAAGVDRLLVFPWGVPQRITDVAPIREVAAMARTYAHPEDD